MEHPKISCIVPAYNEGPRIKGVLNALAGHPLLDEVIVVNDGSKDDTESVLRAVDGIHLISYSPNRGKSHAIRIGFESARNDLVMMIDSDLIGLDREAISALAAPVLAGTADISMSLRKNSLSLYKFFGLDFVSGERVFDRRIIGDLSQLEKLPGFGLESFLNRIILKNKLRLAVVEWKNVITPRKSVKEGAWAGTISDLKMSGVIVRYLGPVGLIKQFAGLLKAKVKLPKEQDSLLGT